MPPLLPGFLAPESRPSTSDTNQLPSTRHRGSPWPAQFAARAVSLTGWIFGQDGHRSESATVEYQSSLQYSVDISATRKQMLRNERPGVTNNGGQSGHLALLPPPTRPPSDVGCRMSVVGRARTCDGCGYIGDNLSTAFIQSLSHSCTWKFLDHIHPESLPCHPVAHQLVR